jgi:pimeloyl-ACP methyl ester carboxylesterase
MTDLFQHNYAALNDVRLHYVTSGDKGPAVVLLHGWPQTWYMWREVIKGLAGSYRVIAPDLRGLGDSSRPVNGYDKKTIAQDVWRLVHDILGEQEIFVAGHDWGGATAFALGAQHRDAVRKMAIFDMLVPGDGTPLVSAGRWHHGLHWELDFPEALTAGREDVYLGFFYRNFGGRPDAISEKSEREYLRTYRQAGAMRAGFNFYRSMSQDIVDNEEFLAEGKLNMPILCYGGALGRGRGELAVQSWERVADNVEGGVLADCGHWIPEERPDWVVEQLKTFFGET